jgi:uncharacterized protein
MPQELASDPLARSEDKLKKLAAELSDRHGIHTEIIVADLSVEGSPHTVYETTLQRHITVNLLINNAGFGTHGHFEALSPERDHAEVMVNIAAVVDLTHAFLPAMLQRGEGAVINVASTAGFQPTPYMAVYGASKAFVLSFSEALWAEYRRRGIHVLALCPGATATSFFDVVGTQDAAVGARYTPEQVVRAGLRALEQGKSYVIEGRANYFLAQFAHLSPLSIATQVAGNMMRPKTSQ